MPNIITHIIFAEEVLQQMENKTYKAMIQEYKTEYLIGTNGPDFWFFYDILSPNTKKGKTKRKIGGKIHADQINVFYKTAIQQYHSQQDSNLKKAMASYLIGHYLHWQLDSITHPYIVYTSGFDEKTSAGNHHRLESMLDTILLKTYWNTSIKKYKAHEKVLLSGYSLDAISNYYIPCTKTCLDFDITKEDIKKALHDWQNTLRYLYDPYKIKYMTTRFCEIIFNKSWTISGSIVLTKEDLQYDICNNKHDIWLHPCTGESSNESFHDLFHKALENTKIGIFLLIDAMEHNSVEPFLTFLDDRCYRNGLKERLPRIYKKPIYQK